MKQIIRLKASAEAEARPDEPIKLLEVNEDTVPSGIQPLHFGASAASGITYPSVIVEVTPDEFKQIEAGMLILPDGWVRGHAYPRPSHTQPSQP